MGNKINLAWVEDEPGIVEENIDFLCSVANIDSFKDRRGYLDLAVAREHIINNHYDAVILDDMFLRKDVYPLDGEEGGEHLLYDIRSHGINKKTPVIIYVTDGNQNLIKRFKRLGANLYMLKHFRIISDDIKQRVYTLNPTKESLDLKDMLLSIPKSLKYELRETAIALTTNMLMLEGIKAMNTFLSKS